MHDAATTDALPTPEQMRNYFAAAKSAQKARRLQDASRAIITGNIAAFICLVETVLVVQHAGWTHSADGSGDTSKMIVVNVAIYGFIAWFFLSLRWLKRQRSRSSVYVRNQFDLQQPPSRRVRALAMLATVFSFIGFGFLFHVGRPSQSAIIAVLSVGPLTMVGFFVLRFVMFRFWEDLLFAVAVALAYLPFPFQAWHLAPLCLASFPMVIVATICLHFRWVRWQRSASLQNAESANEEVRL